MEVVVKNGQLSREEQRQYIEYLEKKVGNNILRKVVMDVDGDYVDLSYECEPKDFERIRRITGYLVGTMDRWNDAKRAEERDRVRHTL